MQTRTLRSPEMRTQGLTTTTTTATTSTCRRYARLSRATSVRGRSIIELVVVLVATVGNGASSVAQVTSSVQPSEAIVVADSDWPWWRGPHRNGIAASNAKLPPIEWDNEKNVLWKVDLPGRGHGSATIVGDHVFIATADLAAQEQSIHCYDSESGERRWTTVVHKGGLEEKGNKKASLASATPACDGQRVFINFLNGDAVHTSALDRDGSVLWQTKITDYVVHQGYGSSPALYGPLVIVSADNKGGGAIAGLDRISGKIVWRHDRPKTPNYASPTILMTAGREQLLFTGCDLVSAYEPLSGKRLWQIDGATTECVTTTVTDGRHIYTSGGYPRNHVAAIAADGSGRIVWENNTRVYVPSMLVHDGHLYAVTDAGVAMCWKADSGDEVWKGRLGGTFSSSPVLIGDRIYVVNEAGEAFAFRGSPAGFELLGQSRLGDEVFATPSFSRGRIYLRVAHIQDGRRREVLYCIANPRT